MKPILVCFACLLVCSQCIQAQSSMGVQNDLKGLVSAGASASGSVISSFSENNIKGSRYIFDNWTAGSVTSFTGEVYSANYTFNFDKINQDIYAKDNGSNVSVVIDKIKIRSFKMGSFSFINSVALKGKTPNVFYQVLVADSNRVSLYKLTTTKFVKANPADIMNVRTSNFSNEYVDDVSYYVSVEKGELKKIGLSENNIRKTLKEKADKVDTYLNTNSAREIDEPFLIDLISYVNQ